MREFPANGNREQSACYNFVVLQVFIRVSKLSDYTSKYGMIHQEIQHDFDCIFIYTYSICCMNAARLTSEMLQTPVNRCSSLVMTPLGVVLPILRDSAHKYQSIIVNM